MTIGTGKIAIMGSGETAPTMVRVHRQLLQSLPQQGARAIMLDTPFGFQENADELSAKALDYFRVSLNTEFTIASYRSAKAASIYEREQFLHDVAGASYIFAGPGSPTYALENWREIDLAKVLRERAIAGATVTFSSAAALTLGAHTLPVYEVYKVGADPYWNEGLNLLELLGIDVAVIPHFNNQEGGHHDTRFCYMGETRLAYLESLFGPETFVLGIDEHTGIIIDLATESIEVIGNGLLTLRMGERVLTFPNGSLLSIKDLHAFARNVTPSTELSALTTTGSPDTGTQSSSPATDDTSLRSQIDRLEHDFNESIELRDAVKATEAVLSLDELLDSWAADTLQSDDHTSGKKLLRSMILRLGQVAGSGLQDPRELIAPFVEGLIELRRSVRADKDFVKSDAIRDILLAQKINVMDSPEGTTWNLEGA